MKSMIIVKSALRALAKKKGLAVARETEAALDKAVEAFVLKAISRAEANGRKTLYARDL